MKNLEKEPEESLKKKIYEESFPVVIGGLSATELLEELVSKHMQVSQNTRNLMLLPVFQPQVKQETIRVARLTSEDLGLTYPTTEQLYGRIQSVSYLSLCPQDTGPFARRQDTKQPLKTWYYIATKPILDQHNSPNIFKLLSNGGGLWLDNVSARPDDLWFPGSEFVVRVDKQF